MEWLHSGIIQIRYSTPESGRVYQIMTKSDDAPESDRSVPPIHLSKVFLELTIQVSPTGTSGLHRPPGDGIRQLLGVIWRIRSFRTQRNNTVAFPV